MNTVIIMANGESTRWNGGNKLLAPIYGKPLINRTIDQIRNYGIEPYVATSNDDVKNVIDCKIIDVGKTISAEETWLKTQDYWKGRTAILWGDVYFTDQTIAEIFESKGLKFFGRYIHFGEGYASVFDTKHYDFIKECLVKTGLQDWKFFDYMVGTPLTAFKSKIWFDWKVWYECDPYTQDIDTLEDYENLLKKLETQEKEVVTITFDDGLVKSCKKATELTDVKMTFFVITDRVEKEKSFDFWMDLQSKGHDVQSHTVTHERISDRNYKYELDTSYDYIKKFHGPPYILAYPYELKPRIMYPNKYDWVRYGGIMPDYKVDANWLKQSTRKSKYGWKQIILHGLDNEGYASIDSNEFVKYVDWLKLQPYEILTMSEAYNKLIK